MLEIYYRLSPVSNDASRPEWFSKGLCFRSCVRSWLKFCEDFGESQFTLGIDGDEDQKNLPWMAKIIETAQQHGINIIDLNLRSNNLSYRAVYDMAINSGNDTTILFAEDDYLWRVNALSEIFSAFSFLPADYLTPYDHPVRYDDNYFDGVDLPHWNNSIYCTGTWHFRSQESTCMTFASKVKTLQEDKETHLRFTSPDRKKPIDRELFRCLQHLGSYINEISPQRLLLGPIPSLATHVHLPFLAPVVDWYQEVLDVQGYNL